MSTAGFRATEPKAPPDRWLPTGNGKHGLRTAIGTLQLLAVQVAALLLGFGVSIVLTRGLGPERYGLYSVAILVVLWIDQSITSWFYQPSVKLLAQAAHWEEAAAALIQAQFAVSVAAAFLLAALAGPLAKWLRSPPLTPYLRLLALSLPISGLARGHQSALVGRGAFGRSTVPNFVYWLVRLLLVLSLLKIGLSTWAGIWAWIGAAAVELFAFRLLMHPPLLRRSSFPWQVLLGYSAPIFLSSMALRLLTQVDLLLVQARAGTAAAGWYSAAQNLSLIPLGFLGVALSSPLLSTLSRLRGRQDPAARGLVTEGIRFLLCLVPFVGLVAGAAPQIVQLLYGSSYRPTAPMLSWLMFGALALAAVGVCGSLLTAAGRPSWTLPLVAPLLPVATAAEWALIPRYGAVSAAIVTSVAATVGAIGCLAAVLYIWQIRLPLGTTARSAFVGMMGYGLGALWPMAGAALLLKLVLACGAITMAFLLLGELSREELRHLRALARRETLHALLLPRTTGQSDGPQARSGEV